MSTTEAPIPAFPLQWPLARPRTASYRRTRASFDTTFAVSRDELVHEVKRLGGRNLIISTNVALRNDGLPYATQKRLDDPGVAAYFERGGKRLCFACDRWDRIEDNTRAIVKTIDALRGIARWGTGDMLEAAFTGFAALPSPTATRAWWEVLGVESHTSTVGVQESYRRLRSSTHPDHGGSTSAFDDVQKAWATFKSERGLA